MLRIGLTGGIGAGKSAVAGRLARLGAVVIDADALAREVVAAGTDGLAAVLAEFGEHLRGPDGGLDRAALGARVFGDPAARKALEAIIHPRVRARTAQLTAEAPADAIVVNDVPLLVEAGLAPAYQMVVVVMADEPVRVERLVRTRGMTEEQAYARIEAQATDAQRRDAADALLVNDRGLAELESDVDALWRDRLAPYEANLRAGRPAARRPARTPADPDPTWPAQARRLIARLTAAAGDLLLRVDHVGATAAPGTPATDLIDIQAVVADLDAAEAVAAQAAPAAGLVRAAGVGARDEVVLVNADPGRPVDVTLRLVTGPAWREELLLRDWRRAGSPGSDAQALSRAQAESRAQALSRARAWAGASGWTPGA